MRDYNTRESARFQSPGGDRRTKRVEYPSVWNWGQDYRLEYLAKHQRMHPGVAFASSVLLLPQIKVLSLELT